MRPDALSKKVFDLIENPKNYSELLLSVISILEFSKLLEKGRLQISIDGYAWVEQALLLPKLRVIELTPKIAYQSTTLPKPIRDDPVDQILIATAREENTFVITKDKLTLTYPHIKCVW